MQTVMIVLGVASASIAGGALGYWSLAQREEQRIIRSCRLQAGAADQNSDAHAIVQIGGIYRNVLTLALSYSQQRTQRPRAPRRFWLLQKDKLSRLIAKAGLAGRVDLQGCAQVRRNLSIGLAFGGFACGLMFSELLALILLCIGFLVGYHLLQAALEQEIEARCSSVERELSQLIEVLVLGLRSGLSFDRALGFYCHYFSCGLSDLCDRLQTQWNHGLITREDGLRTVADSYDSSLLERIMDSIIRSLRFGTSLAETLSNAGAEIRATRKTKIEEHVAKAPVKMLIPIGTLILPAMLIFILGPIILELIGGF